MPQTKRYERSWNIFQTCIDPGMCETLCLVPSTDRGEPLDLLYVFVGYNVMGICVLCASMFVEGTCMFMCVEVRGQHLCHSLGVLYSAFLDRVSHWDLGCIYEVHLAGLVVPGVCLFPSPHAGIISPQLLFQTLHGFQGPNSGLLACTTHTSLTEPPPQPPVWYFQVCVHMEWLGWVY